MSYSCLVEKLRTKVARLLHPPPADDPAALRQAALDYLMGRSAGDTRVMRRKLHPDVTPTQSMRRALPIGGKRRAASLASPEDASILKLSGASATVKVATSAGIDYLLLTKFHGRWVVSKLLWEIQFSARR